MGWPSTWTGELGSGEARRCGEGFLLLSRPSGNLCGGKFRGPSGGRTCPRSWGFHAFPLPFPLPWKASFRGPAPRTSGAEQGLAEMGPTPGILAVPLRLQGMNVSEGLVQAVGRYLEAKSGKEG